jgi:hypothetical protein
MKEKFKEIKYNLLSKWNSFTYDLYRQRWYKIRLLYRLSKIDYHGAWEMVEPIFEYPFELFCEFYEKCNIKNHIVLDIDNTPEDYGQKDFAIYQNNCYEEMDRLYKWYKVDRHIRQEEIDYLLTIWCEHHVSWWQRCSNDNYEYITVPKNKYANYLHTLLREEENKFEQEKEDNLISLMKLRNRLWD